MNESKRYCDMHCHSLLSMDSNTPHEEIIEKAINAGIDLLAFTDHNYWIDNDINGYLSKVNSLKEQYADKLRIVCGIEIATVSFHRARLPKSLKGFEFALIEHLGYNGGFTLNELVDYRKAIGYETAVSIAHTDIFGFAQKENIEITSLLKLLRDEKIAWELNVNLDTIHGGFPHAYVLEFFENEMQQKTVRESGISVTVGFDNHIINDYKPNRVINACDLLDKMNIPILSV